MNIAIIGCGLIGRKRAAALSTDNQSKLTIVADVDGARAEQLAREYGCQATNDWEQVVNHPQVEAVIVSTINKFLMPITIAALERGKSVLCEKPLGRNASEAQRMVQAARANHVILKTGFNHRHHPAIAQAHEICESGTIGPLMFIRCAYGHGGRPGYDKEWRADPDLAGGGELLDQGVHIVDLCRWFIGDFSEAFGATATYFWNLGFFGAENGDRRSDKVRKLEDNGFACLRTVTNQTAVFHTSWTQWKNCFVFEIFGRDGYVIVDGLGGSYGVERLRIGRRRPEGGAPEEKTIEFPGPDISWQAEWQEFVSAIREGREPLANGEDGLQVMRVIEAMYESSRTGNVVKL